MVAHKTQLSYDREFAIAAAPLIEMIKKRPNVPVGDVESRRDGVTKPPPLGNPPGQTSIDSITRTEHTVCSYDGHNLILTEFRRKNSTSFNSAKSAAVYFIHGGGMIRGSVQESAAFIELCCEDSGGLPHFAIDYRLSPEHPHPAPVNDCYAGLLYLYEHAAELGIDRERIVVSGKSAGGGLAAGVALKARDERLDPPIAAQMLFFPMLDDRNQTPMPQIEPFAVWRCDDNITGWRALLGDMAGSDVEAAEHAYAAPARAHDLSSLPPTYIDVGQLDIFCQEDMMYAKRLADAGVIVEFHLYPGLPHAFEIVGRDTPIVRGALANRQRFMTALLQK